jgi:multidrug/hemolysin transport system permease protein
MKLTYKLATRNVKMFLRNKTAVFFSFLSMIIIIALYALFIGDVQADQLKIVSKASEGVTWFINSWIMSGIIVVNAVNVTLAALSIMVEDKEKQYIKDFIVAPIKRYQIVFSYIIASIFIGILMTFISFIIAEIYIFINGGELLSFINTIKVLITIVLSIIMMSSMGFLLFSFVKNEKTVATISTIVGTLIGFFTGVYIPVGVMPEFIQKIIKLFPITYSATILKGIFINEPSKIVFKKAPTNALAEYNELMGNTIVIRNHVLTYNTMLMIIIMTFIVFSILCVIRINKQKRYD